jgi:hypothetical protein
VGVVSKDRLINSNYFKTFDHFSSYSKGKFKL